MTKLDLTNIIPMIIPTVVIPFAFVLAALSGLATFIAGLFGIQLKAEGPKKLLEVLLKPRVLVSAIIFNGLIFAAYKGYYYVKNAPVMLSRIESKQQQLEKASSLKYPNSVSNGELPESVTPLASAKVSISEAGKVNPLWSRKLADGSFRGAVISGPSAFIGIDDGTIHEVDLKSGETRRLFYVGTPISGAPRIYNGALYAGEGTHDVHHARLYKFDLASGKLVGTFTSQGHIETEPVPASWQGNEFMLLSTGGGGLVAVDLQTMTARWQSKAGHVDAAARVIGQTVFLGTGREKENIGGSQGEALALDLLTGKELWRKELPASSWMRPIAVKDRICYIYGEVYFKSDLGGVHCFQQKDGSPDVAFNNGAPIAAEPIVVDGDLMVSDIRGKVCRLSFDDGRRKWCRETGKTEKAFANPVYDPQQKVVVYPSAEGLLVMDPYDGEVLATWKAEGESLPWSFAYAPVTVVEDGWLLVDSTGGLRKLRWQRAPKHFLSRSFGVSNDPQGP